tara:strand:- start:1179 stop:1562 length:384 start_codon:yes stop_codon:yes gene_type:complete
MPRIRKNIFEELEKVKTLIKKEIPNLDIRNLPNILAKLATYHYKKKGLLLGHERKLYYLLIENSYNPFTVYRWTLLERIPEEIKFQLKNYQISQKKASSLYFKRRHETNLSLQKDIKSLGLKLIQEM